MIKTSIFKRTDTRHSSLSSYISLFLLHNVISWQPGINSLLNSLWAEAGWVETSFRGKWTYFGGKKGKGLPKVSHLSFAPQMSSLGKKIKTKRETFTHLFAQTRWSSLSSMGTWWWGVRCHGGTDGCHPQHFGSAARHRSCTEWWQRWSSQWVLPVFGFVKQ